MLAVTFSVFDVVKTAREIQTLPSFRPLYIFKVLPKELRSIAQDMDKRFVLRKIKYFWKCCMGSDSSAILFYILHLLNVKSQTNLCCYKYLKNY